MKTSLSRKTRKAETEWPRRVTVGRVTVTLYRRQTPQGNFAFMVSNYSGEKRRFDCYATEAEAVEAAGKLARQLSERDVIGASISRNQAIEYAGAVQTLKPFNVTLSTAATTLAECLKAVGDIPNLHAAVRFYTARHKRTTAKPVADAVAELLKIKAARGASERHLRDLRSRLETFAADCVKDCGNVTTAEVQAWLDGLKLSPQSVRNYRTVLHVFFAFCVARGYCVDNPVAGTEKVKVNGHDVEVFTPQEIARLLAAASPDFLPCLAIGAFAGLRSAELARLEWGDVRLPERFIVVGASKSKTASRRIVPIADSLAAWLAPCAKQTGKIWRGSVGTLHNTQRETAAATAVKADPARNIPAQAPVKWKKNALRHSFASYSFALCNDAGRVAGYLGNSAQVVHRHYRELVSPKAAQQWFAMFPDGAAKVPPALPSNAPPLLVSAANQ